MSKKIKAVSQHVLFKLCREVVPKASLAHTLAECLYWSQHAIKKIDGKAAIWKTGPELADALGIAPKTANEHLKRLASLGFWELKYRPRPHHPSPVTWLVFTTKATEIVEAGTALLVSKPTPQSTAKYDLAGASNGASNEPHTEVQSSQIETLKQNTPAPVQQVIFQGEFIPEDGCSPNSKHELPQKKHKEAGKEKAPSYLKAAPGVEALVNVIQEQLAHRDMPGWDTSSQFTWTHARTLWGQLNKAGIDQLPEQVHFISCVLDQWPKMRGLMAWRFLNYDGNNARPTPLAFAHEFSSFKDAVFPPPPPDPVVSKGGGWDFSLF